MLECDLSGRWPAWPGRRRWGRSQPRGREAWNPGWKRKLWLFYYYWLMFVTDIGKRNWIDSANQKENYGKCDLFCDSFHCVLDNAWPWKDIGSVDETWRPNAAFIKCGLQTEFWICIIYRPRKHFLTIHFESVHTSNLCTPQWVVESSSIRNASVVNRKTNLTFGKNMLNFSEIFVFGNGRSPGQSEAAVGGQHYTGSSFAVDLGHLWSSRDPI